MNTLGAAVGGADGISSAAATSGSSWPGSGGGEPCGGSMGIVAGSGGVWSAGTCEASSTAALAAALAAVPSATDGVDVAGFVASNSVGDGGVAAEMVVSAGAGGGGASAVAAAGDTMGGGMGGGAGGGAGGGLLGLFVVGN